MILTSALLAALLFIIPGYLFLPPRFDADERLALSPALSLALYGFTSVVIYLCNLPFVWVLAVIVPPVLLLGRDVLHFSKTPVIIYTTTFVLACMLLASSTYYSDDTLFQIIAAKTFTTDHWMDSNVVEDYFTPIKYPSPISYRPPLNSLGMGLIFSIFPTQTFEDNLQLGGVYSMIWLAPLALLVYLIARKLYDESTAILSALLFVTFNPFMMMLGVSSFVYVPALYFVLWYVYLELSGVSLKYLAVAAGLLYLIHPMCFVFLIASAVTRIRTVKLNDALIFIAIAVCVTSPWLVRNFIVFGNPIYTSSGHVSFDIAQQDHVKLQPSTALHYISFISNPINFISVKGGSIMKTFIPPIYSATKGEWQPLALVDPVELGFTVVGFLTYPIFFVAISLLTNPRRNDVYLLLVTMSMALVIFGFRTSYTLSFLLPVIMLLGMNAIDSLKDMKIMGDWVLALSIVFLIMEASMLYPYLRDYRSVNYDSDGLDWIADNTPKDAVIMSAQGMLINVATGRRTMITPNENASTVIDFIKLNSVDYYAVHMGEIRLRGVNLTLLNETFNFTHQSRDYIIYTT